MIHVEIRVLHRGICHESIYIRDAQISHAALAAGHSPDNEPDVPARPKAGRPAGAGHHGAPTPKRGGGGGFLPVETHVMSVPWITEKRKQLEVRGSDGFLSWSCMYLRGAKYAVLILTSWAEFRSALPRSTSN